MEKKTYTNIESRLAPFERRLNHDVKMTFDMNLDDLASEAVIKNGIVANEQYIRGKIMDDVIGRFVPHVTNSPTMPREKLNSSSEISGTWKGNATHGPEGFSKLRQSVDVTMNISADQPLSGFQALYAERANLGTHIADQVLSHIRAALHGNDDSSSRTRSRFDDDGLTAMGQKYE